MPPDRQTHSSLFDRRPPVQRRSNRLALVLLLLLWTVGFVSIDAIVAPATEPWSRWSVHDDASTAVVDHAAWQRLLDLYLRPGADGITRFAYAEVTADDRRELADYVARLSATQVSGLSRAEQFAYWVNLYNALTVKTILTYYPVASIRDIDTSPGLFSDGPWDAKLVSIEGEWVGLNDIEHRILRPLWRDPRLHYAVNCASLGCPNLLPEAFTAANSERLLDLGAFGYVNAPRGAEVRSDGLWVSSIYIWFKEDFGGNDLGIIEHLRRYATPEQRDRLAGVAAISGHHYDWRLNDAATAPGRSQ